MAEDTSSLSVARLSDNPPAITSANVSARATIRWAVIGGFLGLAWGAGLRAWMVVLVLGFGESSHFSWLGTFGGILFPAALIGALLGANAHAEETAKRKRRLWIILSPLLFVLSAALTTDDFISILITTGLGGGAIGVALMGILGGHALSGIGAKWLRWVTGLLATLFTLAAAIGLAFADGGATDAASKAFSGLLFALLMVLLAASIGASIQYRATSANL